ncbi:hypothetical protein CR163_007010 [Prosthecochloris sp. ZM_2]|nr:hypothetical protein CR163_007010 [Prosthecochloris sp. ZM_2]
MSHHDIRQELTTFISAPQGITKEKLSQYEKNLLKSITPEDAPDREKPRNPALKNRSERSVFQRRQNPADSPLHQTTADRTRKFTVITPNQA